MKLHVLGIDLGETVFHWWDWVQQAVGSPQEMLA